MFNRIKTLNLVVLLPLFAASCLKADSDDIGLTSTAVVGSNLFLLGTFDDYTANQVIHILKNNPHIKRVVMTANGGSVNDRETLRLGRYIRAKGLDTHLITNGVAASGGVSLFLSGVKRSVGTGSYIGVHAWAECSDNNKHETVCRPATEFDRDDIAHDLHRDYTIEMLGSDTFYWFSIGSAAHNSIHWLSNTELKNYKVVNTTLNETLTIPFKNKFKQEYKATCHNCPNKR